MNKEINLTYNINNKLYTKDEILMSDELKKEYLNILKKQQHNEKVKNRMREIRTEEHKEQARIKINKRYAEDIEYRNNKLQQARERNQKKALLENKTIKTKRGRPPKFTLDENLKCVSIN